MAYIFNLDPLKNHHVHTCCVFFLKKKKQLKGSFRLKTGNVRQIINPNIGV